MKKPWRQTGNSGTISPLGMMAREAACLAQLGRLDEARAQAAEVLRRKPGFSVRAEMPHYKYPADAEHLREGLLKAGLPE